MAEDEIAVAGGNFSRPETAGGSKMGGVQLVQLFPYKPYSSNALMYKRFLVCGEKGLNSYNLYFLRSSDQFFSLELSTNALILSPLTCCGVGC